MVIVFCQILHTVFEDGLGVIVTKIPFAVVVISITLGLTGLMAWGFYKLEVRYDPNWYIPSSRYVFVHHILEKAGDYDKRHFMF